MRTEPRVSILTPVYNGERYVARCIESVLAQSVADWEQIIVDDGSSDRTLDVVRRYDDPRIRCIALPHRGLPALAETYNAALAQARGELIGILEGDDAWPPDRLERQLPAFGDPRVALSWGRALVIDDEDRVVRRWAVPRASRRSFKLPALFRLLARWNVLPALTVMVRRAALARIGGFRQLGSSLLVDLPTWLLLAGQIDGDARFVDHDLGWYRIHTSNTGLLHNATMRLEHQAIVREVLDHIGSARLRAIGWSERDDRTAHASARLTQGIAYLQQRERAPARAAFAEALRATRSPREVVTALAGYGSALTGIDVILRAQKLRLAAAELGMRLRK